MNNRIWEKISTKYILKYIFSYMNIPRALKIIKTSKKIRAKLEILLFHYQYYYFCILFKTIKIESFENLLNSPYLTKFPEDVIFELILKFILSKKLFVNDYIYLNIDDKNSISFAQQLKLKEKKIGNKLNFMIKYNITQPYGYIIWPPNKDNIQKFLESDSNNNIKEEILYDYSFLFDSKNNIINSLYLNYEKIKYLNISYYFDTIYDISKINDLEYLNISIGHSKEYKRDEKLNIIFSENQFNNIKILNIIQSKRNYYTIKNIIFETENKKDKNYFENLKEINVNEKILNKINLNPKKLQKLSVVYDFRDLKYTYEYIENSIHNILQKYLSLTTLNISFYIINSHGESDKFIQEMSYIFFSSIKNIKNISLDFWELYDYHDSYGKSFIFSIKNNPNKNSKYIIKGDGRYGRYDTLFINLIQLYIDKLEEMDLDFNWRKEGVLYIEENSSVSALTKIRIKYGFEDMLYLPIKSYSSLNVLKLDIENITFKKEFPLFSKNSTIKFDNLEHLEINTEIIDIIIILANNFSNTPNLKFLSIINKNICNTVFPYHKEIIAKCSLLKKLHTFILDDSKNTKLNDINLYYSIYPELRNTKIKFGSLSRFLCQ